MLLSVVTHSVLDEGDDAMTLYAVRGPNPNRSRTLFHVLLSVVTHSLLDEGDDDEGWYSQITLSAGKFT